MSVLHWRGARLPEREPLVGSAVRLEPLDAGSHSGQLFQATAGADELWRYLGYGPFSDEDSFAAWTAQCAASEDPLFYAIVDLASGRAVGQGSYLRIEPQHGVIEIGHLLFSPTLQRTRQATEAIYLWARHAIDDLGYRRLEWKCNAQNEPSRRAAERFGFVFEGVFRQHMVVKDRSRDTAWYSIIDGEWPVRRAAFEEWLAPENFEPSGRQRRSLAEVRKGIETAAAG